ncbi:MAG: ROK family protein [Actinomycetota bacterium]|nr:ROK family protein [Actinomycetota bacterium]
MKDDEPVMALDIGGTKLAAALMDHHGGLHGRRALATEPGRGAERVLESALCLADEVLREAAQRGLRPTGLGVSSKGITREDGVDIAGLPGWSHLRIPVRLREQFPHLAIGVTNDLRAATLAEATWGALKGVAQGLYVNFGTGIGAGIVFGGSVARGAHDAAGEIGYIVPSSEALHNHQPGQAPLEDRIGGRAIPERARQRLGVTATMEQLVLMATSDPRAAALCDEIAEEIALWTTNVAAVTDPERVVIGGGFLRWEPVVRRVEHIINRCLPFPPAVVAASFDADSALVGAGALALSLCSATPGATL